MVAETCCGKKYSTRDPDTYIYFSKYQVKYPKESQKEIIGNQKVYSETIYELSCCKNACTRLIIFKFSKDYKILKKQFIRKSASALEYLEERKEFTKELAVKCPAKKTKYGQRIPLFYGKPVNHTEYEEKSLCEQMSRGVLSTPFNLAKEVSSQHNKPEAVKTSG